MSAEPMVEEALPETGRVRAMLTFYWANMRMSIAEQFQYRVANYFYMIGMIAEPVIYLVYGRRSRASREARWTA